MNDLTQCVRVRGIGRVAAAFAPAALDKAGFRMPAHGKQAVVMVPHPLKIHAAVDQMGSSREMQSTENGPAPSWAANVSKPLMTTSFR